VAWGFYAPFVIPAPGAAPFYPGILPLCWEHLLPVEILASGIAPATPAQMPGGGVLLDRRR
jgi:hypothetical protein